MNTHRLLNTALVLLFVLVPACAYLLDGPSELDAMQASAASTQDAIQTAQLLRMHELRAEALHDRKVVMLAKATP